MTKHVIASFVMSLFAVLNSMALFSQQTQAMAYPLTEDDGTFIRKVSDNGMWAVGYCSEGDQYTRATLWDFSTFASRKIDQGQQCGAFDVSDDGSVVVGSYNDMPAFWHNEAWTILPMPIENGLGWVSSVTPDGSDMVGRVFTPSYGRCYTCHWHDGELQEVHHDDVDRTGMNAYFNELNDISADGNTILGCLNYVVLPNRTAFLMKEERYYMFGASLYDPEQGGSEWNFFDEISMSPNGKWVTGAAYWVVSLSGFDEYYCPFLYNVETDELEVFTDAADVAGFAVDDNGNVYGITPMGFPIRQAVMLKDGQWVSLDNELLQQYGLDVQSELGHSLGNLMSVSADGTTIVGVNGMHTYNWVVKIFHETSISQSTASTMRVAARGGRLIVSKNARHITVYDLMGRSVLSTSLEGQVVDVSTWTSGVYVVTMTDEDGAVVTDKVIIGM